MTAGATLMKMGNPVTLETLNGSIQELAMFTREGFELVDRQLKEKFKAFEDRFDNLEKRLSVVEGHTASMSVTLLAMQEDIETLHEEMRGVHRVFDYMNARLVRVESKLGFLDLPDPDPRLSLF